MSAPTPQDDLPEVSRERGYGGAGTSIARAVPRIDISDFHSRREEIGDALWEAATRSGFFQLEGHGISSELISDAFEFSERFFALPETDKAGLELKPGTNAGWEFMSQVRPSTGQADQKESYQITLPRMAKLWPGLPGFKAVMLAFERANWAVGMKVLSGFASRLGFAEDFFTKVHDPMQPTYQSTLRLLHYLPLRETVDPGSLWRAGAHTDFDCLTLLHQRPGQGGLQLCPGNESDSGAWTDVEPARDIITCNIGDMLMRWSDDKLKSTLHRVRMPAAEGQQSSRYSIAFFCQANTDVVIEPPEGSYEPISAADYLYQRVTANAL